MKHYNIELRVPTCDSMPAVMSWDFPLNFIVDCHSAMAPRQFMVIKQPYVSSYVFNKVRCILESAVSGNAVKGEQMPLYLYGGLLWDKYSS
ncbi:MAG: hypothetical protein N2484_11625 [Clostridia bacterium]|nr:hypothetical protein [Clostridia bacterium]